MCFGVYVSICLQHNLTFCLFWELYTTDRGMACWYHDVNGTACWHVLAGGAAHRPGEGGFPAAESWEPAGHHQHQDGPWKVGWHIFHLCVIAYLCTLSCLFFWYYTKDQQVSRNVNVNLTVLSEFCSFKWWSVRVYYNWDCVSVICKLCFLIKFLSNLFFFHTWTQSHRKCLSWLQHGVLNSWSHTLPVIGMCHIA